MSATRELEHMEGFAEPVGQIRGPCTAILVAVDMCVVVGRVLLCFGE
jgi:hypothetical protein